jgi:hypothetical protein
VASALSWAVLHADGGVTRSIRTDFTAAIYEFATHRRAERQPQEWFAHSAVRERYRGGAFVAKLAARGHFGDTEWPWNDPTKGC